MRFTLVIMGSLFSAYVSAGVYKCTDANGATEYRSSPCAPGHNKIEINVKTGSSTDLDEQENQQILEQQKQQAMLEQQKLEQQQLLKKQADINREAIDESEKNQLLIKNNPDKFSAYAFPLYTSGKLPEVVRNFQDRLPEIERLRRQAAEKALASGQCIRVESAELSSKSSKDALVFLIDCSSAKKFYFTGQELTK
jgi:hypothetical protein